MAELGNCVLCLKVINEGDRYHHGCEDIACEDCAPTYADMLAEPEFFRDLKTDEPMTAAEAEQAVSAHLAAGGKLTDKMVSE